MPKRDDRDDHSGKGRRQPSRRGVLLGLAASTQLAAFGCKSKSAPTPKDTANPEDTMNPTETPWAPSPFELDEITVAALGQMMADGKKSSRDITALYLERIKATNQAGPMLRAVIETNPDALAIAESLDAERTAGTLRGPLHGIPVLLKDNIATRDKMENTAGSLALVGHRPPRDAHLVTQLREAGAVILGKANLSEWANIRSTKSSSGWSARGGLCRSPYVLDRNPCGSSSGSGVAAAANLCAIAVGTETDGSVVCPSSHNSLVGIKPTVGAVSRAGIIPISSSQDTAGPMARTVADAAVLFAAMVGADARDSATSATELAGLAKELATPLAAGALKGARIGVMRSLFGFHAEVDAVMEESIRAMSKAGATVVDPIDWKLPAEASALELDVLLTELKATMAVHLAELSGDGPKTLADLIAFNKANADTELVHFGQELFEMAQKKPSVDDPAFQETLARLKKIVKTDGLDVVIAKHNLDAIIAPTNGPAWTTDLVNGDHYGGGSSSAAAISGTPNVTVPAGFVRGLPVGLSMFGAAWTDAKLVRLAFDFERVRSARQPPTFIASLER